MSILVFRRLLHGEKLHGEKLHGEKLHGEKLHDLPDDRPLNLKIWPIDDKSISSFQGKRASHKVTETDFSP